MHVGLNLIYLVPGETGGMETYARELIPALLEERPDLRLTAFVNEEAARAGGGPWRDLVPSVTVPVHARNRWDWVRGEQLLLPRLAARAGVDLLHSLAGTAPARGTFRRVVTVHDLIYRLYPETHGGLRAFGMARLVPLAARRSQRVIVPSRATRDDVHRYLRIPLDVIDVVAQGVAPAPASLPDEREIRQRLRLGGRELVLSASALRPHKNLARLLEALARIPREDRPLLVVPGYQTGHETELRVLATQLGIIDDTRFVGWIDIDDLEALYRIASCFVFPSLYEGFGLPVLEAMARGLPVACSQRGSLAEVAGDAALAFDPEDPGAIAEAISTLRTSPEVRERLREAGLARAAAFTWRETARGTLAVYERVLAD